MDLFVFKGGEIDFDKTKKVSILLRTLDNRVSRKIFDLLIANKSMTVTEIQSDLNIQQPVASAHLSRMRQYGIVLTKREGRNVLYSLNVERLVQIDLLLKQMGDYRSLDD